MNIRLKTTLVIVGTLLVGGLVGSFITSSTFDTRMERMHRLRSPGGFVQTVEDVVVPQDEAQRAQIRLVLEQTSERMEAISRSSRARFATTMDSMRTELAAILTPEQQERLDAWFKAHRARYRQREKR